MKRVVMSVMIALLAVSCAGSAKRDIASTTPACSLEKHPKKSYFRVTVDGKPYNEYWYGKKFASKMRSKLVTKGECQ